MTKSLSIAVVVGSASDLPFMAGAIEMLKEFGVSHEVNVLSAHRTPDKTIEFAKSARGRGIKVVVAAAGGAAHLAGLIAANTTLPVIGVPVPTKHLGGIDSLLSTVQMPTGIPVATVAIGEAGAKNAGLLAIQMLALSDGRLLKKVVEFRQALADKAEQANRDLRKR